MGQDEKRDERKFDQAEKAAKAVKPAKFGREAKIGAVVIVTLLLGLGIAIGVRVMRSGNKKTDLVGKQDAETPTPSTPPKKDPLFGNDGFKFKPTAGNTSAASQWKHGDEKPEPRHLSYASSSAPLPPQPPVARELETPKSSVRHDPFASNASPVRNTSSIMASDRDPNVLRSSSDAGMTPGREPPRYNRYSDSVAASDSLPRDNSYAMASTRNITPAPPATISHYDNARYSTNSELSRPAYNNSSTYGGGAAFESNVVSHPYGNPARREDGKYEVQPNDNYTVISKKVYGTDGYFKALVEYNRRKGNGDEQLKPGSMVFTPTTYELKQAYPDLCPKAGRPDSMQNQMSLASTQGSYRNGVRTYTVTEGDTLFTIARYELGKASRWAEIYDLNRDLLGKDYNYLRPGTRLTLPEGERADSVARRPGDGYQR